MGHARVAPSKAAQWLNCPGSVMMQERYPETGRSEPAEEGTAAHWVAEQSLHGVEVPAGTVAPNGVIVSEEMIKHVAVYLLDIRQTAHPSMVAIEHKVTIPAIHADCFGTVDAWHYSRNSRELYIWDFKFGYGLIEPEENLQLISYASGIMDHLRLADTGVSVCFVIVQPRPWHPRGAVRTWRARATDLRGYINQLHSAAHEALRDDPPIRSGDHCKYCSAMHACPTGRAAAMHAVDVSGKAEVAELNELAISIELDILDKAARAIAERKAGLEQRALALIKQGKAIPGWALDWGRGTRKWNKSDSEIIILGDLMGVKLAVPMSPYQAEMAGLSKEVVAAYCMTEKKSQKLVKADNTTASKIFGGK